MKKLLFAAFMMIAFSGIAMSQENPKKHEHTKKTETVQKTDSTANASGTHKMWKKKAHTTKHN